MNNKRKLLYSDTQTACSRRHNGRGYMVKGEIWLEKNGQIFVDSNRVTLLRLINQYGSLAAAARTMKLGYNTAWLWIMAMNRLSARPLVRKSPGGTKGGFSALTTHGRKIIAEYSKLNLRLKDSIEEHGTEAPAG